MIANKKLYYIFWILLILVQAVWIFNSGGYYFIDDGSHFNFSRHYIEQIAHSTGAWHRMGRVILFALPAQFGLKGVQIFSAFIFLLTIYCCYKILKHYNVKYAEWIIPIIGFQPVLFNVSYTSLAELPAGFLIVLAFYSFIKDKPVQTMIAASLVFIFRTEYFYAAGIYFLIYACRKNFRALPYILLGPLMWYVYTTALTLNPLQFFTDMTLHSRLLKIDVGVEWYFYSLHSGKIFGFIQMLFFIIAVVIMVIKKQLNIYWIPIVTAIAGIGLQTLLALKGLNLTCSIGQLRYVAVIGPMIGIVAAYGLGYFFDSIKNKIVFLIVSLLLFALMYIFGPYSTPWHNKYKIDQLSEQIVSDAKLNHPDYFILSNLHQIANAIDEPQTGGEKFKMLNMTTMNKYQKCTIVWCRDLEDSPFVEDNVTLDKITTYPGVKLLKEYKDTVNNGYSAPIYQFRKEGDEFKTSRKIIDYMVHDQTTWEIIDVKVFIKE